MLPNSLEALRKQSIHIRVLKVVLCLLILPLCWKAFEKYDEYDYWRTWAPIEFDSKSWALPREMGCYYTIFPLGERRFHPCRRTASNTYNPTRFRMLESLLRKHKLSGKSEDEIESLLGLPENPSAGASQGTRWEYFATRPGGQGAFTLNFVNGKVVRCEYEFGDDHHYYEW